MHVFRVQDCPTGFIEEIMHYVGDTGIYSHDMWCIDELSAYMTDAVSNLSVFGAAC